MLNSHPAAQVTTDFKLELPQVAVVGSQSSGKSSVLESLVRTISVRLPDHFAAPNAWLHSS